MTGSQCNLGRNGQVFEPRRKLIRGAALLWILLAVGCGRYESRVSGVVTVDGSPASRGTITFYPSGGGGGAAAYAQVDEDGRFQVQTGGERGLQAGEYKVSVRIVDEIPAKSEWDPPGFRTVIPLRYKNPQTSGLVCSVEPGKNEFNIDISTQDGT